MFTKHNAPTPSPLPAALQKPVPNAHASPIWTVLAIVWALGAVAVLTRTIVAQVRTASVARRAAPIESSLAPGGMFERVRVVVGPESCGPHVVGFVRPRIVVPPALVVEPA